MSIEHRIEVLVTDLEPLGGSAVTPAPLFQRDFCEFAGEHDNTDMAIQNQMQARNMAKRIFSACLLAEIERTGIKQDQLAEEAGCSQSAISDYKNGERIPSGEILVGLARALGTTAEYLITGQRMAYNSEPVRRPPALSEKTIRLAKQAAESISALQDELKDCLDRSRANKNDRSLKQEGEQFVYTHEHGPQQKA